MAEVSHRKARIIAVVAATCTSLACGTNYAYSAWAPQFAERMQLSATQSNLIGAAGNIGMYASGIPVGLLVDNVGHMPSITIGAICLAGGYFPAKQAYDEGPGSRSVAFLCFLGFLTGLGSCAAFSASLKVSALNWPHHRGTATAFPLAAFGLSAFFFTTVSGIAFPHSTSNFLLLLSIGTFGMVCVSMFFMRVPKRVMYAKLATVEDSLLSPENDMNGNLTLTRTRSSNSKSSDSGEIAVPSAVEDIGDAPETSSILSSNASVPGDIEDVSSRQGDEHSPHPDITGLLLLREREFWKLWVTLGLLTGVGLMTINNIGNDAQALWSHYDPNTPKSFILSRQLFHVGVISVMSFTGRLISGIGSDYLVKRLHMSRFWCLVFSSSVFTCAQMAAIRVETPHFLWCVSALTGLAYGALFGVYPALVADAFGVRGLSLNWGFMTLSPVLSGNIFNLTYGAVFDKHSNTLPGGELVCPLGLECYRSAYYVTLFSSLFGVLVCLWSIHHESVLKRNMATRASRRVA